MAVWSFSGSRLFQKCPRQWYFKHRLANALAKDETRHEAYLLSKLQSVSAWRGSLVDQVIVKSYVLPLSHGRGVSRSDMLIYARKIFDQQIRFALNNKVREPGMTVKKAGESFAALYEVEYGDGVEEAIIQSAWNDIETALLNLLEMSNLRRKLISATHLIAQRPLIFSHEGIKAKMTPDLVAFFNDQPPLIVDWKVHAFGSHAYRLQLALYALALTHCDPHSDFPKGYEHYAPTDVQLIEAQLLKKQQRQYQLTSADIEAVSNYMGQSALEMSYAVDPFDGELSIDDLPTTNSPEECPRCPFRSLCWSQAEKE